MALLAHQEQAGLRAIPFARVATARAALVARVGVHRDTEAARQGGFVGQQSAQRGLWREREACRLALRALGDTGTRPQLKNLREAWSPVSVWR